MASCGASFYKYKAKFGGMDVSDARKLRTLEDENAKLKKLLEHFLSAMNLRGFPNQSIFDSR